MALLKNYGGKARPEVGEMSIAPYKRRDFGGAQCGVIRANPIHPEHADFKKAIHLFEGFLMEIEWKNRGRVCGDGFLIR